MNDGPVFPEQQLSGTELAVVVESHCEAMRTSVMDHHGVAGCQFRKHAVNGKLVIIFTKRACDIVHEIRRLLFFAQHGDVMIGAVNSRPHQIGHAGIEAGKLFVRVLDVQYF